MSDKPFRWRTVVEVGVISAIIYVLLGAPGLKSSPQAQTLRKTEIEPPLAQAKAESLVYPDVFNLKCPEHKYNIHVFSATPLVVYIDGFLSEEEADHLVDIRFLLSNALVTSLSTDAFTAPANGKDLQCSAAVTRRRTRRSANRRRHLLTETTLYSVSSSEPWPFKDGLKILSSRGSGLNATM